MTLFATQDEQTLQDFLHFITDLGAKHMDTINRSCLKKKRYELISMKNNL